jgi:hypothetical protein
LRNVEVMWMLGRLSPDHKTIANFLEHPYGTIKDHILGNARLLMRGLAGARAELSLAVLAYNLKRVVNLKGSAWMRNAAAA